MSYLEVIEILSLVKSYNHNFKYTIKDENVAQNDREREIIHNWNLDSVKPYTDVLMPLNFEITKKVLQTIISNEKYQKHFSQMPIPTLTSLTIQMTDYSATEKQLYYDSLDVYYGVDDMHGMMLAYNKRTGEPVPLKNRPMNAIEEDYYVKDLMSKEEYEYYNHYTDKKPSVCYYNPKTRTSQAPERVIYTE